MSKHSITPIILDADEPLTWSPHAPALSFRVGKDGWRMDEGFQMRFLRAKVGQNQQTAVRRNEAGAIYYLPHWPDLTTLMDAHTDKDIVNAARKLAKLAPGLSAPEIGFSAAIPFHLLLKKAPSTQDVNRGWEQNEAWLAYWTRLTAAQKKETLGLQLNGWGLLDLAIRKRNFQAAEMLWEAGHRFDRELLAEGTHAWAFTEGLFTDIPSLKETTDTWQSKKTQQFLQAVVKEELPLASFSTTQSFSRDLLNESAFLLLTHRWLRRLGEEKSNINATVKVEEAPLADGTAGTGVAHRTPFMQALYHVPDFLFSRDNWATMWVEAMERDGYAFGKTVEDSFVLRQTRTGSITDFAQAVGLADNIIGEITALSFKERLGGAIHHKPRARM